MVKILFVCLGNICRSPLAEGIARDYIKNNNLDIIVDSAGTGSWHIGEPPCLNSQKVAKLNGIDISNLRARQINNSDKKFDYIFALDKNNLETLKSLGFEAKLLCFDEEIDEVPDPYFYDGFEGFDIVFEQISRCVIKRIKEII